MVEADRIQCSRCGREDAPPLPKRPFPNELGRRVQEEICRTCWEEWKQRQMLLINHYGLNLQDPEAREFLLANLRSFLFGEGPDGADIDTSKEGDVSW